jgi:hypothetical protein
MFEIDSLLIPTPENIYYHPTLNKFFQGKGVDDVCYLIGGLCTYYSDAQTNISRSRVSYNFIKDSKKVVHVDKYAEHDGIGWRVKSKK